jgi:hypothetical protein
MSWKYAGAFNTLNNLPEPCLKTDTDIPKTEAITKPLREATFTRINTEVLQTDYIESSLLMINNNDLMVTTKRANIHTSSNSLQIPANGPITLNNALSVDSETVHIHGNLQLENNSSFHFGHCKKKVTRISLDADKSRIQNLSVEDYSQSNTIILDCENLSENAKSILILNPYDEGNGAEPVTINKIEYLYSLNLIINADSDSLVDIDIRIPYQGYTIKLHSRYSSVSLLWIPEGKWLIDSIGFKTTIIEE